MVEENLNNEGNSQADSVGQSQSSQNYIPEEPKERVKLHTLSSDLERMKKKGGEVDLSDSLEEENAEEDKKPLFTPPSFREGNQEVPLPPQGDNFPKEVSRGISEEEDQNKKKLLLLIGVIILAFVVAGTLAFYFLFFKKANQQAVETNNYLPTPIATPKTTPTPLPLAKPKGLLTTKAEEEKVIEIPVLSREAVYNLLAKETQGEKGTLKEIFLFLKRRPVSFSEFLSVVFPEINSGGQKEDYDLKELFEDNFSLVITYPEDYPQLSYIAQIKEGKKEKVKELIKNLISDKNLPSSVKSFHFFVDPGEPSQKGFLKGKIGDIEVYLLTFDNPDLAFDFGLTQNNKFIAFTSMKSLKIILKHIPDLSSKPIE